MRGGSGRMRGKSGRMRGGSGRMRGGSESSQGSKTEPLDDTANPITANPAIAFFEVHVIAEIHAGSNQCTHV